MATPLPLGRIPAHDEGGFHVVVESPRGATVKWKYAPDWNAFTISRPLPRGLCYPFDWGFVPSTRAPDGDPLDVMIAWEERSVPGAVLPCRALGVLEVEQDAKSKKKRERNDRVIAVPLDSPRDEALRSVLELPERFRKELEQFFLASIAFEEKNADLLGWKGPEAALALVEKSARAGRRSRR
jgi:inorganic pyrophosphatase